GGGRVELERPLMARDRLFVRPPIGQRHAQIHVGLGVVGLTPDRRAEARLRLLGPARVPEDGAQVIVRLGVLRPDSQGGPEASAGGIFAMADGSLGTSDPRARARPASREWIARRGQLPKPKSSPGCRGPVRLPWAPAPKARGKSGRMARPCAPGSPCGPNPET